MPINLQCMSLDQGREPEYPEETPEARGEHANSTHTAEAGVEPPTLESINMIFCDTCRENKCKNESPLIKISRV
ncbi:hypothetical protein QTP86_012106 [Hemibagrus guttatus]|nr:hypothetical protein QTP86_012106 [Hemibagrus guttatus]